MVQEAIQNFTCASSMKIVQPVAHFRRDQQLSRAVTRPIAPDVRQPGQRRVIE